MDGYFKRQALVDEAREQLKDMAHDPAWLLQTAEPEDLHMEREG